ncbi:hypothetical protein Taro_029136 [Colocasia esculenta]|uniref:Uncharacterized protein n=1 Tax=Colocasia esculenta TaxID=4460 RepID=A0A843VKG5_COLES|nr:hypothetical protein [Colocasia esculenta]
MLIGLMVGTSEPGIGPTRSKFTQTEATSSDDGIHLAWRLAVGPLAWFDFGPIFRLEDIFV